MIVINTEKGKTNIIAIVAIILSILSVFLYRYFHLFLPLLAIFISIIGIFDINKHNDKGKTLAILSLIICVTLIISTNIATAYSYSHYNEVDPIIPQLLGIEEEIETKKEQAILEDHKRRLGEAATEFGEKSLAEFDINNYVNKLSNTLNHLFDNLGSIFPGLDKIASFFIK